MIFKQLFQGTGNGADTHPQEASRTVASHTAENQNTAPAPHEAGPPPQAVGNVVTVFKSFEQIYEGLGPQKNKKYDILKVAEMTRSPHLATMSVEAKRSSLMMALEAAGVDVEDVLQDAMMRQRALDDYEENEETRLREFEERKLRENCAIQAELDLVTAQFLQRIQVNLDAVEREQDLLRAWQKRKQQESNRIAEAASFSVPSSPGASSISAVADRIRGRSALAVGD